MSLLTHFLQKVKRKSNNNLVVSFDIRDQIENKNERTMELDSLTNLPNRTYFNQELKSLIDHSEEKVDAFSILYLDIDRFRTINNSFDHVIADQLLILFSQRLRKNINTPSLLARIGGNEFAILLWDYSQKDYPVKMSESIMNSLRDPFFVGNHEFNLTVGIGISTYPANGTTLKELLKNTEAALFQAKRKGKNHYHISSSPMTITSYKQYYLERDLHYSIKNNQLRVHLQPRVDTLTGKIVSAEALVRWEHPVWGLVSPNEFIPLAEEIGFINDIGDWVLNEVCTYLSEWQKNKLSVVPISINISSDRFFKSDWKSTFYKIMDETHVDPSLIELEITETTLIKHKNEVQTAIQFLKGLGVKIALDDFGTGYSSLSHINDFSIDTIKIDQFFIKQITQTANVEIIIQSLIHLAKGLKMRVVAEGVETIEQLTFLKQLECHEIQGYIFSKPVPENDFRLLLHKSILNPMNKNHPTNNRERRSFFRMNLQNPLSTYMTLVSINDKKVEIGKTEVLMEDIGPGGIRFLSNIQLPLRKDITLQFETKILGQKVKLWGHLMWKNEINDVFQYGVKFSIKESKRDSLIKLLNQFSLQQKSKSNVQNCSFITENRFTYLKNKNHIRTMKNM